MVIDAPYNYSDKYDEYLPKVILAAREDIKENNDDRLFICVGPTGVGKSMLAFHILDNYTQGDVHLDYLAASRESFAVAIKKLKDKFEQGNKGLPLWFDEADSDNLEQNAKWNKRLFSLYMKIRFLNGFHIWCWPSLKAVDRRFVEERVNGIFFCYTKEQNKPRSYAFFPKQSILRMIDNKLPLNYYNLRKQKEKYAAWIGKYRDYTGKLKEEYLKIKHDGGFDAVDDFFNDFGEESKVKSVNTAQRDYFTVKELSLMYNLSEPAVIKRFEKGIRGGLWVEAETKSNNKRILPKTYLKAFESRHKGGDVVVFGVSKGGRLINARSLENPEAESIKTETTEANAEATETKVLL